MCLGPSSKLLLAYNHCYSHGQKRGDRRPLDYILGSLTAITRIQCMPELQGPWEQPGQQLSGLGVVVMENLELSHGSVALEASNIATTQAINSLTA